MSMTIPRAVCLTNDPALRRTLRRALQAAGSTVEFADSAAALATQEAPAIILLDREARRQPELGAVLARFEGRSQIVVLGESLEEEEVIKLLGGKAFDHVIAEISDPDDELVITSNKLLRGDIFGIEKYLAWGVLVHEHEVTDYEQKRLALAGVAEFARETGARRQSVSRIETVTDELLMNALYDAPAVHHGVDPHIGDRNQVRAGADRPVLVRYGCDGRFFAVSVRDVYGLLRKESVLDNVTRARAEKGNPRAGGGCEKGAGLGLYFVISAVTRFVANVHPMHLTEVIGLFDLRATGHEHEGCARSLHVFTTSASPPNPTRASLTRTAA